MKTEFNGLTIEVLREDRDASNCTFDASKHWVLEVSKGEISEEFDYYGGSMYELKRKDNLLFALQCILGDASYIIDSKTNDSLDDECDYYDMIEFLGDVYEYLTKELGEVSAKQVRGMVENYHKAMRFFDSENDLYDCLNALLELNM